MLNAIRTSLRSVGHHETLSTVDHLEELRTRLIVSLVAIGDRVRLLLLAEPRAAASHQPAARPPDAEAGACRTRPARSDLHGRIRARATSRCSSRPSSASSTPRANTRRPPGAPSSATSPRACTVTSATSRCRRRATSRSRSASASRSRRPSPSRSCSRSSSPCRSSSSRSTRSSCRPSRRVCAARSFRPMFAVPFLFVAGVLFGYFVVLPAAVRFFQNFNSSEFNVLVQASQYYKFAATTLLAMGLLFQVPVAIMAVTRGGIITPRQLRKNRRYAVLACGGGRRLPARGRDHPPARDRAAVPPVRGRRPPRGDRRPAGAQARAHARGRAEPRDRDGLVS